MPSNETPKDLIRSMKTFARFVTMLRDNVERQSLLKPEEPLLENYVNDLKEKLKTAKEGQKRIAYFKQATHVTETDKTEHEKVFMDTKKAFNKVAVEASCSFMN